MNRYEKEEEERKSFFTRKWLRKNTRAVSVGSRGRLIQAKRKTEKKPLPFLENNKPNKQNVMGHYSKLNFS